LALVAVVDFLVGAIVLIVVGERVWRLLYRYVENKDDGDGATKNKTRTNELGVSDTGHSDESE
jgi:hypothetical protein